MAEIRCIKSNQIESLYIGKSIAINRIEKKGISMSSRGLTLMVLVTNLANTKRCKKPDKCLKTLQMGTQQELFN